MLPYMRAVGYRTVKFFMAFPLYATSKTFYATGCSVAMYEF